MTDRSRVSRSGGDGAFAPATSGAAAPTPSPAVPNNERPDWDPHADASQTVGPDAAVGGANARPSPGAEPALEAPVVVTQQAPTPRGQPPPVPPLGLSGDVIAATASGPDFAFTPESALAPDAVAQPLSRFQRSLRTARERVRTARGALVSAAGSTLRGRAARRAAKARRRNRQQRVRQAKQRLERARRRLESLAKALPAEARVLTTPRAEGDGQPQARGSAAVEPVVGTIGDAIAGAVREADALLSTRNANPAERPEGGLPGSPTPSADETATPEQAARAAEAVDEAAKREAEQEAGEFAALLDLEVRAGAVERAMNAVLVERRVYLLNPATARAPAPGPTVVADAQMSAPARALGGEDGVQLAQLPPESFRSGGTTHRAPPRAPPPGSSQSGGTKQHRTAHPDSAVAASGSPLRGAHTSDTAGRAEGSGGSAAIPEPPPLPPASPPASTPRAGDDGSAANAPAPASKAERKAAKKMRDWEQARVEVELLLLLVEAETLARDAAGDDMAGEVSAVFGDFLVRCLGRDATAAPYEPPPWAGVHPFLPPGHEGWASGGETFASQQVQARVASEAAQALAQLAQQWVQGAGLAREQRQAVRRLQNKWEAVVEDAHRAVVQAEHLEDLHEHEQQQQARHADEGETQGAVRGKAKSGWGTRIRT